MIELARQPPDSLYCMVAFSRRGGDLSAKAKLGGRGEESLGALKECLHVSSLHVRTGKRLFAIPLFNKQQSMWIVHVFLETDPMASCLIGNDDSDNGPKLAACLVDFIGLDRARNEDCDRRCIGVHMF
jgi:hypothetical protein